MKRFRSSFPPLPDSFILIFRAFDVLMSVLMLIPSILCVLAAFGGVTAPGVPAPFFGIGFLAVAAYFVLMIYGFSLDFRSGDVDTLEIKEGKADFLLRNKVKKTIALEHLSSVKLVKIRLFSSYAFYAVFVSPKRKAVAEISGRDMDSLEVLLQEMGLQAKQSTTPFFVKTISFRR